MSTKITRVTGVGGIFIKAHDPEVMKAWYRDRLGIDVQSWGGTSLQWHKPEAPTPDGCTVWSVFNHTSDYFAPSTAPFMVNYRVADLHALLAALRAEGCQVMEKVEESEYGKFGWVMDPEGNKVELWEPPASPLPA